MYHKPFPAKVSLLQYWKHRWVIMDLLNQIAHGSFEEIIDFGRNYGASDEWSRRLYAVSKKVIQINLKRPH